MIATLLIFFFLFLAFALAAIFTGNGEAFFDLLQLFAIWEWFDNE